MPIIEPGASIVHMSSESIFLDFIINDLPPASMLSLYSQSPEFVMLLFRWLSPQCQYTIARLASVAGPLSFSEIRNWHPPHVKGLQNKALWRLKQLQIVQGKAQEVWMSTEYQNSFLSAALLPKSQFHEKLYGESSDDDQSESKWEDILYAIASADARLLAAQPILMNLLISSRLIEKVGSNEPTIKRTVSITKSGFQFLLIDRVSQIWTLLVEYMKTVRTGDSILLTLRILAQLSLGLDELIANPNPDVASILSEMEIFGLVVRTAGSKRGQFKYQSTKLATLLAQCQGVLSPLTSTGQRSIILESNYKIYAYTQSRLDLAILSLFVRIRHSFPNMIAGQLTQDSVQGAYSKGITADQLIQYLSSHAHPRMISEQTLANSHDNINHSEFLFEDRSAQTLTSSIVIPFTIIDQLKIWELDRNRVRSLAGVLYQQFLTLAEYESVLEEVRKIHVSSTTNLQNSSSHALSASHLLYSNPSKRILVVSPEAHILIRKFLLDKKRTEDSAKA